MKALSILTLTLHFFAVQLLIGSLVAVIYFSVKAKGGKDAASSVAALATARRLPIIMTFVINLGVPPLLFAQVLYGRAFYSSSILLGVEWLAVVFLVMACYWLLYRTADRTLNGKPVHWQAGGALVLAALVGHIYASVMTLMLKPEVWQEMYAKTATGLQSAPHDPTLEPRLLFVLVGGLLLGGLWLTLHSKMQTIASDAGDLLRRTGSIMAVAGAVGELVVGFWAYSVQPAEVQTGLHTTFYTVSMGIWGVGFILALLGAVILVGRKANPVLFSFVGALGAFLGLAGAVIVRDGIRDVTLLQKGFDVWKRVEYSNWFVIGLFLLLLVLGIVAIGWLLLVMKAAKPVQEKVIS